MAKTFTKESAGQLYATAVIMSFLAEGGMYALGQRIGDCLKFQLNQLGISDPTEFEERLQESLDDACTSFALYTRDKEARKRASRRSQLGTTA